MPGTFSWHESGISLRSAARRPRSGAPGKARRARSCSPRSSGSRNANSMRSRERSLPTIFSGRSSRVSASGNSAMKQLPALKGLAICGASGALFSAVHAPLPWMIGPLLAMALCKVLGASVASPRGGRAAGQLTIACALGLYFTPVVGGEIVTHWYLLVAAALLAVLLAYASGWFLMRTAGLDATTALFASVPGGAAEMTVLGERFGARSDRVVLAQALRVFIVVLIVPFVFTALGLHGADPYRPAQSSVDGLGLITLLGIAAAAGSALARLRVP